MSWRARVGVALGSFLFLACGPALAADRDPIAESRIRAQAESLIYSYDWRTDTFVRSHDITSKPADWRLGSPHAYWGNRLEQYRFLGPAKAGGVYEALRLHHEELKLDPRNYQYHR